MTGPEHYRKAEGYAAEAVKVSPAFNDFPFPDGVTGTTHAEELIGLANAHATLALAAATALDFLFLAETTTAAWADAIGSAPDGGQQ